MHKRITHIFRCAHHEIMKTGRADKYLSKSINQLLNIL